MYKKTDLPPLFTGINAMHNALENVRSRKILDQYPVEERRYRGKDILTMEILKKFNTV
jgi:hypothetical protein